MKKPSRKIVGKVALLMVSLYLIIGGVAATQAATVINLSTTWKFATDPDRVGTTQQPPWYAETYDDSGWGTILSGQSWESQGWDYAGYAWYRQQITIPIEDQGTDLKIFLASIYADDDFYFNGVRYGGLDGEYKYYNRRLRTYMIPASAVHFGATNTIAIRVWGGNLGSQGKNSGLVAGTYQAVLDKYQIMARPTGGAITQEIPIALWDLSGAQQGAAFELVYRFDPATLPGDPVLYYTLNDYAKAPIATGTTPITTGADGIARGVISVDAATSQLIYLAGRFRIDWQVLATGEVNWTDTGEQLTVYQPTENYTYTMKVYRKNFAAGTVSLPADGDAAAHGMYTIAVSGASISNLNVADTANAADWSIQSNLQTNNTVYGDRNYIFSGLSPSVLGQQWIRTACDSKSATVNPVVTFTISQQADVYVGVDTRVGRLPWVAVTKVDNLKFSQRDQTPLPELAATYENTPYGSLKLVDRIDCATPLTTEIHPYLQSAFTSDQQYNTPGSKVDVTVNTILGKQARESAYGWFAYRIGRGQLTPGRTYLLRIEYPEDKPRYCPIEIQAGQNYMDVGWRNGVSPTDVYDPWPLSNTWQFYDVIVPAGEETAGEGGAGHGDGKNGFWVYFMNKMKPGSYFTMYEGGPAVATISLYEIDPAANAPAITLPQGLPQRTLMFDWERQPTQMPAALVDYAKLMGYSAISPLTLKWAFANYADPAAGYDAENKDDGNYWVTTNYVQGSGQAPAPPVPGRPSIHQQYLTATQGSGIDYIPRFEYGGSYDLPAAAQAIGADGNIAPPNRFYTWGANLLNSATWTDLQAFMDSLMQPYAAANPQLKGALWRIRCDRMQISYGPDDVALFCAETNTSSPPGLTNAQLANWASTGEVGAAYAAWWQGKRAAFHQQLVNLLKSYRSDITLYYYNWDQDKFSMMRPDLNQAGFYTRINQIGGPAAYAEDRAARATYTAADYINVMNTGDFLGPYNFKRPDYAIQPSRYANIPGIQLFAPVNWLCYADKPDYLNYFQTKDGLAASNCVSYDEVGARYINPKFEGNMMTPGGGPFSMALELLAYYHGDARTLTYTVYTYGRGFADAHRRFAQAFRALPAVPGYVAPDTPADTRVRTYPTVNGTYIGIAYKGYTGTTLTIDIPGTWNSSMVVTNLVTNEVIPTVIVNGKLRIGLYSGPMELHAFRVANGTPQSPAAPDGLVGVAGNNQVSLSWRTASEATSYNVKRATTSGGPYTTVAAGVTATEFTNTGLANGTTYYYVVSAVNASGESADSSQVSAAPQPPPAAPTGLTASGGAEQVLLSWTASSGAASYSIRRALASGGPYATVATGVTGTEFTNTGLTSDVTYYFVVSAVSASGESPNSNQASAIPMPVPPAPTGLAATANIGQVALYWTASSGAASYNVKRATISGGPYTTVATGVTATDYTDTGLANDMTYYYVVSAVNAFGTEGPNSAQASGTTAGSVTITSNSAAADDGNVTESNETSNIGGTVSSTCIRAGDTSNDCQIKGILSFDTSALPDSARIVSATLRLCRQGGLAGTNPFDTHGACYVDIKGGTGFNGSLTLESADFQAAADAAQVATLSNAVNALEWSTGSLNAAGLSFINKTGYTQFRVYFALDDNDDLGSDYTTWYSSETSTVSYRPVLEVIYDLGPMPTGLTAMAGDTQVVLSWTAASGATGYNIKYANVSGGPYATIATGVTGTSYTDTGLANGITYYYVVSADVAGGESANSNEAGATPQPPPPAAPTGLTATAGDAQAALSWTASGGATSYNVKRATTSGGPYTTVASVTGTNYTNTGLTNGTTYYYVVSAVNGGGESPNSNQASATPHPTLPGAPTNLTATAGNAQVTLYWTASSGATSYNVKRATVSGGPYTTIAPGVTGTGYTDAGLANGTTYYFVVSAVNGTGESPDSNEAGATPGASTTVTFTSVAAHDGWVLESNETANVGGSISSTVLRAGDHSNDNQYKAILSFDTSSIPDTATIISATLKLCRQGGIAGTNPFDTHGVCYVDIKGGTGFNASLSLENADFQAAADAVQVATLSNAVNALDWSTGNLNATGLSFIDKTGYTQFRVYFALDDNNDRGSDYINWYAGDDTHPAYWPMLEIVYQ